MINRRFVLLVGVVCFLLILMSIVLINLREDGEEDSSDYSFPEVVGDEESKIDGNKEDLEKIEIEEEEEVEDFDGSRVVELWNGLVGGLNVEEEFLEEVKKGLMLGEDISLFTEVSYIPSSVKEYGFLDYWFPYPNGMVKMIWAIMPEQIGRTHLFVQVEVDGEYYVELVEVEDMVPREHVFSYGEDSDILVIGSKLDENMFTDKEEIVSVGLSIKFGEVSSLRMDGFHELDRVEVEFGNRYVVLKGGSNFYAPYVYTEDIGDGVLADKAFIVTSDNTILLLYEIRIVDGKIVVELIESENLEV